MGLPCKRNSASHRNTATSVTGHGILYADSGATLGENRMTRSKKFCLMTFGRAGSTALINLLRDYPDIMVPSKQIDCVDNELVHHRDTPAHVKAYEQICACRINSVDELIECFYNHNAQSPYCGFKSMPDRHPDFRRFTSREDIQFITLVRADIPSTVASFMLAMAQGTWRRDGGIPEQRWTFTPDQRNAILRNLSYLLQSLDLISSVPNAISLTYEELCQPDFGNAALNDFFAREIRLANPRPPTSGEQYVTNWNEFSGFITEACQHIRKQMQTSTF
jgi:hypothetical protein